MLQAAAAHAALSVSTGCGGAHVGASASGEVDWAVVVAAIGEAGEGWVALRSSESSQHAAANQR